MQDHLHPIVARAASRRWHCAPLLGRGRCCRLPTPAADRRRRRQFRPTTASAIRSRSREGEPHVEMFIGADRGGLTPSQRAERRCAFAQAWRREATGGFVVERAGRRRPTSAPPRDARARSASILGASGVPPHAIEVAALQAGDPARSARSASSIRRCGAQAGPCGVWPDDIGPSFDRELHREPPRTGISAAPTSAISPPGRQPGRSGAAARRDPGLHARAARPCSKNTARASRPPRNTRMPTRARSATSANDQVRRSKRGEAERRARRDRRRATSTSRRCRASRSRRSAKRADTAAAIQAAGEDRRMAKAHCKMQMGGVDGGRRGLSQLADAQRHHASRRRAAATSCSAASIRSPRSATPARASSSSAISTTSCSIAS